MDEEIQSSVLNKLKELGIESESVTISESDGVVTIDGKIKVNTKKLKDSCVIHCEPYKPLLSRPTNFPLR